MPDQCSGEPAIDRTVLDQLREDLGPDHLPVAIDIFLKDLRARVAVLRTEGQSAAVLRKEAHAIKGAAATFGLVRLAARAAELESAARHGEAGRFGALVATVIDEAGVAPALLA